MNNSSAQNDSAEKIPHYTVDLTQLHTLTQKVAPQLKPIADAFLSNLEKIREMHLLPYMAAADGVSHFFWTLKYVQAAVQSTKRGVDAEIIQENTKLANELFSEFLRTSDATDTIAIQIDGRIKSLMQTKDFKKAYAVLFLVTTPLLWTAFETVARDVWVVAINEGPASLAHRTFTSLEEDEFEGGIGRKLIEVGVLAKHGFDLRGRIGTLLQDKFHFSSVEGIAKAYRSAFPNEKNLLSTFDNSKLKDAECARHLIIHKAGVIDHKYKTRSGCEQNPGDGLSLTDSQISEFGQAIVDAGINIVTVVGNYLAALPKPTVQESQLIV